MTGLFGTNPIEWSQKAFANYSTFKSFLSEYYTFYPRYPTVDDGSFTNRVIDQYTLGTNYTNYLPTLIQILSEQLFICPIIDLASIYSRSNNVYLFSFEQLKSPNDYPLIYGVIHGDELAYVRVLNLGFKYV